MYIKVNFNDMASLKLHIKTVVFEEHMLLVGCIEDLYRFSGISAIS